MKWYAVARGRTTGIFATWEKTRKQVEGFPGAVFKAFPTRREAERFLEDFAAQQDMSREDAVIIYTDGSYARNRAGFGVVVIRDDIVEAYHGRVPIDEPTNQKAELYAVYVALQVVPDEDLIIYSDSEYTINSLSKWIHGWLKKRGEGVKNWFLIRACYEAMQGRKVTFHHVYGHRGNHLNELADQLAKKGRLTDSPGARKNVYKINAIASC